MTPEQRAEYAETMRQLLEDANSPPFNDLARDAVRIASMILADADQQAAEISRLQSQVENINLADAAKYAEACAEVKRLTEEAANFKTRLNGAKLATCQGALEAMLGNPLHTVANSEYAARSLNGDAWEDGWQFINNSATAQEFRKQHTRLRTALAETLRQAEVIAIELSCGHANYAEQLADNLAAHVRTALGETP